jgi:hypothetical protein
VSDIQLPSFSRPTSSSLGGKQTVPIKTMVSDEVAEAFGAFAKQRGYGSASDCMRELILVAVYGEDFIASLHRERITSLYRKGSATGQEVQP